MTNHLRLISFPLGMVVDIALFTPWFCRLQCSAWCVKKDGSNVLPATMELVTARKADERESILERNETIPHGAAHKAVKNQPGRWVLRGRRCCLYCPRWIQPVSR